MNFFVVILIASTVASALVCGSAQAQRFEESMESYLNRTLDTCGEIAVKAKDINVLGFCVAEMLRPYVQGRSCITMVAQLNDPGYNCDAKGMLYYEVPVVTSTAPIGTEQMVDAFRKTASRYTQKAIAVCMLNNESKEATVACLMREKERMRDILTVCANTKFEVRNDAQMIGALEHCIEYKWRAGITATH